MTKSKVELLEEVSKELENIETKALFYMQTGSGKFHISLSQSKAKVVDLFAEMHERTLKLEKESDMYKQLHKNYLDKFTLAVGERNRLQEELKKSIGWTIEYDADERMMFASDVAEELQRILGEVKK